MFCFDGWERRRKDTDPLAAPGLARQAAVTVQARVSQCRIYFPELADVSAEMKQNLPNYGAFLNSHYISQLMLLVQACSLGQAGEPVRIGLLTIALANVKLTHLITAMRALQDKTPGTRTLHQVGDRPLYVI